MAGLGRGAKALSLGLLFTKATRAIAVKSLQSTRAVRDPGPVRSPLVVNSLSATATWMVAWPGGMKG